MTSLLPPSSPRHYHLSTQPASQPHPPNEQSGERTRRHQAMRCHDKQASKQAAPQPHQQATQPASIKKGTEHPLEKDVIQERIKKKKSII
ncbi:uncharacterized protein K452DRAFT_9702 [Aplosporella prunicola CBS 121167]|uniref:Uncharacterized protein n=1 Tax=Aplosporella prunicola CBS 121167 TaxID=1176127 RepID=A0A6A6BJH3_9PEZI|nr:uncharacterized protein K452DRAFT_9702 [Aplosporella prunicola CBS 121167]KAF2142721.1 hypothetical protein K452DRAFT_9702 [Aplosporella prunicola CBS 121167]